MSWIRKIKQNKWKIIIIIALVAFFFPKPCGHSYGVVCGGSGGKKCKCIGFKIKPSFLTTTVTPQVCGYHYASGKDYCFGICNYISCKEFRRVGRWRRESQMKQLQVECMRWVGKNCTGPEPNGSSYSFLNSSWDCEELGITCK